MDKLLAALRACAEPTRLRILALAARGSFCVMEFTEILGQSQPRLSRHLRLLGEAGLAGARTRGGKCVVRPAAGGIAKAARWPARSWSGCTDDDATLAADRRQAARVLAERARAGLREFPAQRR